MVSGQRLQMRRGQRCLPHPELPRRRRPMVRQLLLPLPPLGYCERLSAPTLVSACYVMCRGRQLHVRQKNDRCRCQNG